MAGYDIEFLHLLFLSKIKITGVGDHRQATFSINNSMKNKQYRGNKIINLFTEWSKKGLCSIEQSLVCKRCVKEICVFTKLLFPEDPSIISGNEEQTEHDGIFLVSSKELNNYIATYLPQVLRYDKRSQMEEIGNIHKFYVAITRARQSVAFIYDGEINSALLGYIKNL